MKEYLTKLKSNPIFQLSLGSKELFHSNFIAWILEDERLKEFAKEFVKEFTGIDNIISIVAPKREKQNIDLQFTINLTEDKHTLVVIENKVKSLPYENQLNEYKTKINKTNNPKFYLLSLTKPNFESDWIYKTYNDLAIAMNNSINRVSDEDLKVIIKYYIDFIENLHKLSEKMVINFDNELFDYSISRKPFQEIRLHDLYLKLKHQQIADKIRDELDIDNISIYNDFTRSQGIVGSSYNIATDNGISLNIGMQLQGSQFRYVSHITGDNISIKNKSELAFAIADKLYKDRRWLIFPPNININTNLFEKTGLGHGREKEHNPNAFCSYNKVFIYKYDLIKKDNVKVTEIIMLFKNLNKYIHDNKRYFSDVLNDELQKLY